MSNYRPALSWHFVFTRESGSVQGGRQLIFTRENGCSLLRRTENGPSFERVQLGEDALALPPARPAIERVQLNRGPTRGDALPRKAFWPDEPRSLPPCSTRNPGRPGFRASGARETTVLAQAADRRPLLRFESPRSTVMRDPPK